MQTLLRIALGGILVCLLSKLSMIRHEKALHTRDSPTLLAVCAD